MGIYIGGTGSANHLEDYEDNLDSNNICRYCNEGTQTGRSFKYKKVGNLVTFAFDFFNVSNMKIVGNITIDGLPFANYQTNFILILMSQLTNLMQGHL